MDLKKKQETIKQFQKNSKDVGSSPVQIALLTGRINALSKTHLTSHKKDFSARHGLIKLVGRRQKLLRYLKENTPDLYKSTIETLGLRK